MTAAPSFDAWLDDFFRAYFEQRPVNSTFVGVHDHDHRLPDLSETGAGDALAEVEQLLQAEATLPSEPLSPAQRIDATLARGFLEIQKWELTSTHFDRGNPSVYTGEAVFGLLSLFLTPFAPIALRAESAVARMHAVPALLEQCVRRVRRCPAAWTLRAMRECRGARAFLTEGVPVLMNTEGIEHGGFVRAAEVAARAFGRLEEHLEQELLPSGSDAYACGPAALARYVSQGHFLDASLDDIELHATAALEEADAHLKDHARDFGATTPAEALTRLEDIHPPLDRYYARYRELWDEMRATVEDQALLTWPEFPIRYVPRPRWVRGAAPDLYFLYYRSPAAYRRPPMHDYLVTPIDPEMPQQERAALLRANNDSVIKLNHVIHHGGVGHHVQNWHAFRAASRIGRMAAVDCASRIAMFCGGTMAEGWACYATDLMSETGFLTPLEQYAERQSRRRMAARAIVDVRLHDGRFTMDGAAEFYQRRAGMHAAAARGEVVKNSMFPGAALMYLFGTDTIHALRSKLSARQGASFDLCEFHDTFLSHGSIPVSLIARAMTDAGDPTGEADGPV